VTLLLSQDTIVGTGVAVAVGVCVAVAVLVAVAVAMRVLVASLVAVAVGVGVLVGVGGSGVVLGVGGKAHGPPNATVAVLTCPPLVPLPQAVGAVDLSVIVKAVCGTTKEKSNL